MSAGTGVTHSEFNHSKAESVHLLQIWIQPERAGMPPSYEQRAIPPAVLQGRLGLIAAPRQGTVKVHQDVQLYAAVLAAGQRVAHTLQPDRRAWLQVARGTVTLNGQALQQSDGAAVTQESRLEIASPGTAEVLLFDLA